MVARIPLIVNPSAEQIQEVPSGDTLVGSISSIFIGNDTADNWRNIAFATANGDHKTLNIEGTSANLQVNPGTAGVRVKGDITAFYSSDEQLKDNITPIPNALDKVISISGNTFNWNEKSEYEGKSEVGVIAQEVEQLDLPGVTTTRDNGYKAVRYEKLVPLLIEAIKELKAEVDELKSHTH
tara:strand:- start:29 stop:574 length:546 start_codon:yes stop_codon:yes gene_type:complete